VLEAGCGVGAQTVTLASRSPAAHFTAVDVSERSLDKARMAIAAKGLTNVAFRQADIFALPFAAETFDHVFLCFVLEHLPRPREALRALAAVLRPGGTLTVIEGDHGSAFFSPPSQRAQRAVDCLIELQARAGGDAQIGRTLYPLLRAAGFAAVRVSPRFVYADASRPAMVEGFTRKTFTPWSTGSESRRSQRD
jgi:ubiquinone/menaquinone biosynthesis C-methylase UbiE